MNILKLPNYKKEELTRFYTYQDLSLTEKYLYSKDPNILKEINSLQAERKNLQHYLIINQIGLKGMEGRTLLEKHRDKINKRINEINQIV